VELICVIILRSDNLKLQETRLQNFITGPLVLVADICKLYQRILSRLQNSQRTSTLFSLTIKSQRKQLRSVCAETVTKHRESN